VGVHAEVDDRQRQRDPGREQRRDQAKAWPIHRPRRRRDLRVFHIERARLGQSLGPSTYDPFRRLRNDPDGALDEWNRDLSIAAGSMWEQEAHTYSSSPYGW
jgi:hypothetical protein